MYLLDTNVISELRKAKSGKANKRVIEWANSQTSSILFISAITILEIETGILLKQRKDPKQADILQTWLHSHVLTAFSNRILSIDTAVALQCAKLHIPDPRSDRDALIAATAIVHSLTVITRNTSDFLETGCKLINPWNA